MYVGANYMYILQQERYIELFTSFLICCRFDIVFAAVMVAMVFPWTSMM